MWGWVNPVAVLLGLFGPLAAWYSIFRQRPKKMVLNFEVQQRPTFPVYRNTGKKINFEFDGAAVEDPYEVSLYLRPEGPRDLKADDFGGKEIPLDVGAPIVAILDQSCLDEGSVTAEPKARTVKIAPQVLKRGELASVRILVQGQPEAKFEAKLAEVARQAFDHTSCLEGRHLSRPAIYGFTGFAAAMLILSGVIGWRTAHTADRTQAQLKQLADQTLIATINARAALSGDPNDSGQATDILKQLGKTAQSICTSKPNGMTSYQDAYNCSNPYYNEQYWGKLGRTPTAPGEPASPEVPPGLDKTAPNTMPTATTATPTPTTPAPLR